jgi:hypothetical protein
VTLQSDGLNHLRDRLDSCFALCSVGFTKQGEIWITLFLVTKRLFNRTSYRSFIAMAKERIDLGDLELLQIRVGDQTMHFLEKKTRKNTREKEIQFTEVSVSVVSNWTGI